MNSSCFIYSNFYFYSTTNYAHSCIPLVHLKICTGTIKSCFENLRNGGLIYHADVFQPLTPGRTIDGYIKRIREDGRIDISLAPPGGTKQGDLEERIVQYLQEHGGSANISDKSPPDDIYKLFQTSKKNFKRALSVLYKTRKILLEKDATRLVDD